MGSVATQTGSVKPSLLFSFFDGFLASRSSPDFVLYLHIDGWMTCDFTPFQKSISIIPR